MNLTIPILMRIANYALKRNVPFIPSVFARPPVNM